jgi:pimeloyl-ACP methyl ester carboxylesterase
MRVIFSHGKESTPNGSKIKRLSSIAENYGFSVESIDYRNIKSPDDRAGYLLNKISDIQEDLILVGSSMGGYVSIINANNKNVKGIFLLAPALYVDGYNIQDYFVHKNCEIVHGWNDDIIPCDNSILFSRKSKATLHLIAGDHRLNSSMTTVENIFESFLNKFK